MARQTSVEAYSTIKESGLLGKRQLEVYEIVYQNGPMTASEAFELLKQKSDLSLRFDSNTHARFTECRDMGLLSEVGERKCKITGRNVIEWDVTANLPQPVSERDQLLRRIQFYENKIVNLRKKLFELEATNRSSNGTASR